MGTQGTGRKRSTKKERSTAEDDALNLIAREAEARLAAKRAARAEAREIRMKELERQQKELSDEDERMSVGSRGSVRVEDRDYLEKGSRAASALTAATLTSLGGTSSRRGSGETAITVDAETSIREIKDALVEVEEKYRKAMVSNAQLDNEKNNLMYQVDILKDSLMELEELLSESRREYEEKVKEYEREKHAHSVLQFQFNEMKETLKQSEELLNKHGIILGPDLNINGDSGEAEVDGSPSADPPSQPAPVSQTSPTEGNSMLGNTVETQLRSSGEEELDPEQHQAFEEAKENHLSSNTLSNVAVVSTLETSSKEKPSEEPQTCLATEEDTVKDNGLSKDSNVDVDDRLITEAKDVIICSPGVQGIVTSSEEHVPETPEGGDLVKTSDPDLGETEIKSSSVDTYSDDIRESCSIFEDQENRQKDNEERCLRNTEVCPQQIVEQDVVKEDLPDESDVAVSNTETQQQPETAKEAANDEAEEIPSKSQPQGATASGKKKKKKKKGKKKGGTHNDKNQQKDETDKEKGKTEKDIKSAVQGNTPTEEPEVDGSVDETLKESRVDQVKNDQDMRETEEVEGVKTISPNETFKESGKDHVTDEPNKEQTLETEKVEQVQAVAMTETFSHIETSKEIKVDHIIDEQAEEQSLENETVEATEAVRLTEIFSNIETLNQSSTDPKNDEQDKEQTLENEEVGFPAGPVSETNISTSDLIDSNRAESTGDLDTVCTPTVDNSKSGTDISANDNIVHAESEIVNGAEDEVCSIDERKSENTTNNSENTSETVGNENTEAESHVPGHGDAAANESDAINDSDSKDNTSVSLCSTDGVKNLSGSEPPPGLSADMNSASDDIPIEDSDRGPEEEAETVQDDEKPEQESCSVTVISPHLDGDNTELEPDKTEKEELDGDLKEPESLVEPDNPSDDKRSDSCDSASLTNNSDALDTEKSLLETVVQDEQLADVKSQKLQCEDQIDRSNAEGSSETEEINTINSPKEVAETESVAELHHSTEELSVAEDPEHKTSQNDQQTETNLCPLAEQLHELSSGKSEDNDTPQPTLQDSDEDEEDDEGQSFDFDDMDVEAAIETNLPKSPIQEEVQQEVEVVSDESNNGSSGQCQNNTESNENTQVDDQCSVDGGNQVDVSDKESDTNPQDDKNSQAHEEVVSEDGTNTENVCEKQKNTPMGQEGAADEPVHITEEVKVLKDGELAVVGENINQPVALPVEEGLDAFKHESQGEALVSSKSADEVATSKVQPQAGKDVKKNSKKGKGKGKEECKMS